MSSFLVTGDETHRIEFENGEWIDIRRSVSGIDAAAWVKAATITKTTGIGRKATTTRDHDVQRFMRAKLEGLIVDSSAGRIDVAQLTDAAVDRIFATYEELNPASADEDAELGESESPSLPTTE